MAKTLLSAVILTKNEEEMLADCLTSVKWADEIIIVDDKSVDGTVETARKFGARVFVHRRQDFARQREFGAKHALGDWLLYLDADERITEELRKEIKEEIENPGNFKAFQILRKHNLLGKWMKHGGWSFDYQVRLIKKDKLISWQGEIHESPKVNGPIGRFKNPLVHFGHRSLEKGVEKTIEWSRIEARLMLEANHPKVRIYHLIKVPLVEFTRRFFLKTGFRDGTGGFIEAAVQSFNKFFTYANLWALQNKIEGKLG